MGERRITRINDEIHRCISEIIRLEIRDPRVSSVTSVTKVKTSVDLEHCIVYISALGDNADETIKILNKAAGYIRKLIAQRINLRVTPEFKFVLDDSIEYSAKINNLLKKIQ